MALEPIGWQSDLCWRLAARHGLDFYVEDDSWPRLTTKESGFRHPSETREATGAEADMWRMIVPEEERRLISEAWRLSERPLVASTPDEVYCAVCFHGPTIYLAAEDFAVARRLRGLTCLTDRESLRDGLFGTFEDDSRWMSWREGSAPNRIYVSRDVPHGYFISSPERIGSLHWRPPDGVRQLRPPPDDGLVLQLRPIMTDGYNLSEFGSRDRVRAA